MSKTRTAKVTMFVEVTLALKAFMVKRGRLLALGAKIPVQLLPSPKASKPWLCAEVDPAGSSPWDVAHKLSNQVKRQLGQAIFVEPRDAFPGTQTRYASMSAPVIESFARPRMPHANPLAELAGVRMPGSIGLGGSLQARSGGGLSRNFGLDPSFGMPVIPDPLKDILPDTANLFGPQADLEPLAVDNREDLRRYLSAIAGWDALEAAIQEMFATETAQLVSRNGINPIGLPAEVLVGTLADLPDISRALQSFVSGASRQTSPSA